jgi:hypothetical protein
MLLYSVLTIARSVTGVSRFNPWLTNDPLLVRTASISTDHRINQHQTAASISSSLPGGNLKIQSALCDTLFAR